MLWRFNPFDYINEREAQRRVDRLKKNHPDMSKRQLCDLVIARKIRWCAAVGVVSSLPGIFPGLGTLFAFIGGAAIDIMALMYFMSEMIMEMGLIYGRDFSRKGAGREAMWVFLFSVGTDAISKNVSKIAVKQMGRQAFVKVTQDLLVSLGVRISQRSLVKIIPLLGALLSGVINYIFARKIGAVVADYYENNSPGGWQGETIDV